MDESADPPKLPPRDEFNQIVNEANSGSHEALSRLRDYLDKWPQVWKTLGDLAQNAQIELTSKIAGKSPLIAEAIGRKLNDLRAELLLAGSSPLEKLAVERVLSCFAHAQFVDIAFANAEAQPQQQARFLLQLRESCERRFDMSIKSLATLRRLLAETPAAKKATLLKLHAGA